MISYNYISGLTDEIYPDMIHSYYGAIYQTREPSISNQSKDVFDFKTGVWFTKKKFFSGISLLHFKHLLASVDYELPLEIQYVIGNEFLLSKSSSISATLEIRKIQALPVIINPSCYLSFKKRYIVGLTYSNLEILNFNMGITLFDHLSVILNSGHFIKPELTNMSNTANWGISIRGKF